MYVYISAKTEGDYLQKRSREKKTGERSCRESAGREYKQSTDYARVVIIMGPFISYSGYTEIENNNSENKCGRGPRLPC